MLGAIIPAPLSIPAIFTNRFPRVNCRVRNLGNVSVVMNDLARFNHDFGESSSSLTKSGMALVILSIGNGWPMTPVDITSVPVPSLPGGICPVTPLDIFQASSNPFFPVTAFAFPEFTMKPLTLPSPDARSSLVTVTGAALNTFLVTQAAAEHGRSAVEMRIPRSRTPGFFFTPQWVEDTEKPSGKASGP